MLMESIRRGGRHKGLAKPPSVGRGLGVGFNS